MIPVRRPDWRGRLSAVVEAALQRPFEWGVHDCALFAGEAVLAMTDVDLAEGWRGRYRTQLGALRVLKRAGHPDHVALAAALLPEIHPARASVGDIAAVRVGDNLVIGVVIGPTVAAPGPADLEFVPRTEIHRAFHVPFDGEGA